MPPRKNFVLTDAERKLAEDNIKLAYWYAGRIYAREPTRLMGMNYDNCVSLAMEALCRAAHWYREDSGCAFTTVRKRYVWASGAVFQQRQAARCGGNAFAGSSEKGATRRRQNV